MNSKLKLTKMEELAFDKSSDEILFQNNNMCLLNNNIKCNDGLKKNDKFITLVPNELIEDQYLNDYQIGQIPDINNSNNFVFIEDYCFTNKYINYNTPLLNKCDFISSKVYFVEKIHLTLKDLLDINNDNDVVRILKPVLYTKEKNIYNKISTILTIYQILLHYIVKQVIEATIQLQDNHIIHKKISLSNILIKFNNKINLDETTIEAIVENFPSIRIGDFKIAVNLGNDIDHPDTNYEIFLNKYFSRIFYVNNQLAPELYCMTDLCIGKKIHYINFSNYTNIYIESTELHTNISEFLLYISDWLEEVDIEYKDFDDIEKTYINYENVYKKMYLNWDKIDIFNIGLCIFNIHKTILKLFPGASHNLNLLALRMTKFNPELRCSLNEAYEQIDELYTNLCNYFLNGTIIEEVIFDEFDIDPNNIQNTIKDKQDNPFINLFTDEDDTLDIPPLSDEIETNLYEKLRTDFYPDDYIHSSNLDNMLGLIGGNNLTNNDSSHIGGIILNDNNDYNNNEQVYEGRDMYSEEEEEDDEDEEEDVVEKDDEEDDEEEAAEDEEADVIEEEADDEDEDEEADEEDKDADDKDEEGDVIEEEADDEDEEADEEDKDADDEEEEEDDEEDEEEDADDEAEEEAEDEDDNEEADDDDRDLNTI